MSYYAFCMVLIGHIRFMLATDKVYCYYYYTDDIVRSRQSISWRTSPGRHSSTTQSLDGLWNRPMLKRPYLSYNRAD